MSGSSCARSSRQGCPLPSSFSARIFGLLIELAIDVDARRGRVRIKDVMSIDGEPIRNPITGAEHRVRIDLPHGFEYELAEIS